MNKIAFLLILTLAQTVLIYAYGQLVLSGHRAVEVLQKVNSKMTSIKAVEYIQYKNLFYKNDNYRENDTSEVLLVYNNEKNPIVPRYQITESGSKIITIYNGTENFILNRNKMSLDVEVDTSSQLSAKHRFFRQSWANIRNLLPEVIKNDSIQKEVIDTTVLNEKCLAIKIYYPQKRFNASAGFYNISADTIQWRYELLINKSSLLSQQFNVNIQTPHNREDFIKVRFDKIVSLPKLKLPNESSWYFSTYRKQYPNHTAKRNDLAQSGIQMPDWKLPIYVSDNHSDTLNSKTLNGKVTLLEFWIKGCSYCMAAMPDLNEIRKQFGKDEFQLVTVNCYDTKKDIDFIYTKYQPNYTICYNGRRLAEKLGIYGYPMALLINQKGIIVDVAPFSHDALVGKISEMIHSSGSN